MHHSFPAFEARPFVFDKNLFAATRRTNMQIKARRDSFTGSGLNKSQVKDEAYNGIWLGASSPLCSFTCWRAPQML